MKSSARKPEARAAPRRDTRDLLLDAAMTEFNAGGFHGTDTNRIARRAGFAPQTFYRHFADKTDAFIHVYARWQADEVHEIIRVLQAEPDGRSRALNVAAGLLRAHRQSRVFRRSLRLLAVEDDRVRKSRADSRRAQLESVRRITGGTLDWREQVAALLTIERLCDAAADEETADLDIDPEAWTSMVARAIEALASAPPRRDDD